MRDEVRIAGEWWRWSAYEVVKGYVRPVRDATLERYSPWIEFAASRDEGLRRPYELLVDVFRQVDRQRSARQRQKLLKQLLCEWCRDFGLLGVLPHQLLYAVLPGMPSGQHPTQTRVARAMTGPEPFTVMHGRFLVEQRLGAIVSTPTGVREATIEATWGRFVSASPAKRAGGPSYPPLMSDTFWRSYGEPISEFRRAAVAFSRAMEVRATRPRKKGRRPEHRGDSQADYDEIGDALGWLVAPVRLSALPSEKDLTWLYSYVAPSLLSHLGLMLMRDFEVGHSVMHCAKKSCGRLFTTPAYQTRYCSAACMQAARMYRYRVKTRSRVEHAIRDVLGPKFDTARVKAVARAYQRHFQTLLKLNAAIRLGDPFLRHRAIQILGLRPAERLVLGLRATM